MRIKAGVQIGAAKPPLIIGLIIADSVYREITGDDVTVTSICDGVHSPGSLHKFGLAADLRTRGIVKLLPALIEGLKRELGREWDVVLEPDHIHIEFDPEK